MQKQIRVKAMCLFVHEGRVLVADASSFVGANRGVVPGDFFRVLGGSINFGETAEQGVKREIMEELGSEISDLRLLDVVENIFTYAGEDQHEIAFLFKGVLERKELLNKDTFHVVEADYEFDATWVPIEDLLSGDKPLYPSSNYARFLK
jgi:ADP-ribose pyrophosphatase YjhB (NUDIX family)